LAKVTELPLQAFYVNNSIKEIFLPKVTSVKANAIMNCPSLTKLIFGSIITDWNTDALGDNLSQTGATVPGNIDLVLKKGQTGVSGNTFNGLTFKSITFMD
jgi:argininosuccinate synthase